MRLPRGRTVALRGLHLLVLSSFGVAQPLFDILGDTPEFFVVRGSMTLDIVAFALALVLVPPALLLLLETLAGLADPRAGTVLHVVFVALLLALVAAQALKRIDGLSGNAVVALSLAAGALVALAYVRRAELRSIVTVLAPAPALFLALFLINSPLEKLSLESDAYATPTPAIPSETPVVLVILDELATASLLDGRGRIDAERLPSFAAFARQATFFRNATTVHEHTTESIPAILTGRNPRHRAVPLFSDHPENLFTLLADEYAMNVFEPVTQLCPTDVCPRVRDSFAGRMASLAEDLGIVYLHVLLPEEHTRRLPSVTDTWQGYGKEHADEQLGARPLAVRNAGDIDRTVGRQLWRDLRFQFERYVASVENTGRPTLFFFHSLLSHSPWRYLPSGRRYGDALAIEGLAEDRWSNDGWLVAQGWQRHLLQIGFVDRLLGRLVRRLRAERLYDDALVILTADHGISFRPGDRRRGVTPTNLHDIAPVPLLVKRPGQRSAQVVERHVRTTDIVPTVADVLDVRLPWAVDGRSLFDSDIDRDDVVVAQRMGESVAGDADEVARRNAETVARQAELFAGGLFAVGPNAELIGRAVTGAEPEAVELRASVDGEAVLGAVDPESALSPSHLTGRLEGERAEAGIDLALAINSRIACVARSFGAAGSVRFSAFAPEDAFREGANEVEVFAVLPEGELERLGGTGDVPSYALSADGRTVEGPEGRIAIARAGAEGEVEDWYFEAETVRIGGWAGDVQTRTAAETVLVFADGELAYSGTPSVGRAELGRRHPGLGRSGFVVELPRERLREGVELRFVALHRDRATELAYADEFPWKPGD
ncbi:MAG: sulfatase-like hydrolase/transferase [Actinomycetota bacterium]|nr:sulfatase-like hydrolase/transferase [Actinomycetota bacterium]